jgi:dihydroorotase-like cyclic amidohydrolase
MKLDRGRLAPGLPADLALVDLNAEYRVDASMFHGRRGTRRSMDGRSEAASNGRS